MHIYSKQEKLTTSNLQPLRMSFAHISRLAAKWWWPPPAIPPKCGTPQAPRLGGCWAESLWGWLNSASATTAQQLRLSNYASATTPQQLRISNYASATTTQQPRLSNHGSATKRGSRFSNYASATKTNSGFSNHASATNIYSRFSNQTSATKTHTPSGKHIQSHILHVISKSNPSGKYMHSLILHVISKSHPLWQVHAQSHLTRHIKIPPPLASTCTVTSDITRSKSHPLWQAHARSHLTRHIKIPPPLAGTCKVSSYTSCQNPTPSGKYMRSLILHVISESHPLWQVHAQSHLTRHIKIPPPLASTRTGTSHITRSKSHPLWQVHARSHLTRHIKIPPPLASTCAVSSYTSYQNPTPSGKYMRILILHVISKSHPLWQVHAKSHLTRHIKIPPPLASTCTVSSYTFTDLGLRNIVYEQCFTSHGLRIMVYEPWFTEAEVNHCGTVGYCGPVK